MPHRLHLGYMGKIVYIEFISKMFSDDNIVFRVPLMIISSLSMTRQRTGGLFGLTNTDPFASEPSSPTSAQTSQRPLQFSETRPEDVESPPDSVFLPNTEFFPTTPTRTNTNNNANFTEGWVLYSVLHSMPVTKGLHNLLLFTLSP